MGAAFLAWACKRQAFSRRRPILPATLREHAPIDRVEPLKRALFSTSSPRSNVNTAYGSDLPSTWIR
jgi:hypothetical protein